MHLVLMGPPGSGKGTQAKIIAQNFNLEHISTGDLLRKNPNLSKEQRDIINSGDFIPDNMMLEIVKSKLETCHGGWILDGYPRTLTQAKNLQDALQNSTFQVIYFDIDEGELLDRITGRLTCSNCDSIFHKKTKPPIKENICDNCGGALIHRKDDTKETIKHRLEAYHNYTAPVVKYFKEKNVLASISTDNSKSIDQIFDEVREILKG